jgi:two-component system cell cycle response regulator
MNIYNHQYFDGRLKKEFLRSVRYQYPLSLIMVDISHFKKANDNSEHQTRDLVLKRLADLLRRSVRDADVVCRYGSEEVAVILPHTPDSSALIVAEKLKKMIETTEVLTENIRLNMRADIGAVSLGVSTLAPEIETADMLLNQACRALYTAKKSDRNCVFFQRD